jgi:hypothetical protein
MRPFKASKFTELETTSITRSLPTRYCDRCHLSTPKANPLYPLQVSAPHDPSLDKPHRDAGGIAPRSENSITTYYDRRHGFGRPIGQCQYDARLVLTVNNRRMRMIRQSIERIR